MANITLASTGIEDPVMCTKEYMPVCGEVQVQCVRAPCYPVKETFGNRCEAMAAHATNIQNGTCESQSQKLFYTNRKLASFDGETVVGESTLYFARDTLSAKVCNSKSASYSAFNHKLTVGPMMSTLMACDSPLGTYEAAFDLSGATYSILGSKLTIDTVDEHRFVWTRISAIPAANEERKYGFIIWQVNQLLKAKNYDTVEEKKTFVLSLINRIDQILMTAKFTPIGMYRIMFIRNALQYYYDHIK